MSTAETKNIPIDLHAHEVRGILEGRQTQLRRVVGFEGSSASMPHVTFKSTWEHPGGGWVFSDCMSKPRDWQPACPAGVLCPFGVPGERLWVRETWQHANAFEVTESAVGAHPHGEGVVYAADQVAPYGFTGRPWRSPIHLPRRLSRITLEITDVRVERVQDISESDAKAEGAKPRGESFHFGATGERFVTDQRGFRDGFRSLWVEIHGDSAWEANPFVWCLTFKLV